MYWSQLIQCHMDLRCGGAPEHEVVKSLARSRGISHEEAARQVEMAVLIKDIRRIKCSC